MIFMVKKHKWYWFNIAYYVIHPKHLNIYIFCQKLTTMYQESKYYLAHINYKVIEYHFTSVFFKNVLMSSLFYIILFCWHEFNYHKGHHFYLKLIITVPTKETYLSFLNKQNASKNYIYENIMLIWCTSFFLIFRKVLTRKKINKIKTI